MDWVTLSRQDVENDGLPRVCAYCGGPSRDVTNRTFEWCPEWIGYMYLLGILPGAILHAIYGRKMRVALPVCDKHNRLGLKIGLVGGLGWLLLPAPFAGLGAAIAAAVSYGRRTDAPAIEDILWGLIPGLVVGLIVWLVWLIRLASLEIKAEEITDDGILLHGLAHDFVMAVKAKAAVKEGLPQPRINPDELALEKIQEPPSDRIRD